MRPFISLFPKNSHRKKKKQTETAKIDWEIHNPIEAAQLEYDAANKELVEAQKSYNLADSEQKQATKYFQIASKIDYPKEKAELANLVNQLNKLYDATTFVTGPQLNHFRNQILKLQPSYEDKKQKVTLYEKTKNKLDESNKKLGIALESKKKAEAKEKKAKDNKEKEERRKKPGIATGKGKKVGDKWLDDAGKNCGKRFTKTPNCVNNLILKIKEI